MPQCLTETEWASLYGQPISQAQSAQIIFKQRKEEKEKGKKKKNTHTHTL